ncbi:hypothetical protein [Paraburkholderia sartisoli]|nr:hypothetical protein [Paraburkholderia sartisoli]
MAVYSPDYFILNRARSYNESLTPETLKQLEPFVKAHRTLKKA